MTRSSSNRRKTVNHCLRILGIESEEIFEGCANVEEEFKKIKKCYYKRILASHPDKPGGDAAVFLDHQASFDVLRDMFNRKTVTTFLDFLIGSKNEEFADIYDNSFQANESNPTPSWEYYFDAAATEVPPYMTECARSNRSSCKAKGKAKKCVDAKIPQGEPRIGSIDDISGTYSRWVHLSCWRVPFRIWNGLPDPEICQDKSKFENALIAMNELLLVGFGNFSPDVRHVFIVHVMDKNNWARKSGKKGEKKNADEKYFSYMIANKATNNSTSNNANDDKNNKNNDSKNNINNSNSNNNNSEIVLIDEVKPNQIRIENSIAKLQTGRVAIQKKQFAVPVLGVDGVPNSLLGQTVVLTGLFPELGGGTGLSLGKVKAKNMISIFGGRVTSAISGRTDILLVGKEPGVSKVTKARASGKVKLLDLDEIVQVIRGGALEQARGIQEITQFSTGYNNNALSIKEATRRYAAIEENKATAANRKKSKQKPKARTKKSKSKRGKKEEESFTTSSKENTTFHENLDNIGKTKGKRASKSQKLENEEIKVELEVNRKPKTKTKAKTTRTVNRKASTTASAANIEQQQQQQQQPTGMNNEINHNNNNSTSVSANTRGSRRQLAMLVNLPLKEENTIEVKLENNLPTRKRRALVTLSQSDPDLQKKLKLLQ